MSLRDELMDARRDFAGQVAALLAGIEAADVSGIETARRALGGEFDTPAALLAAQPEIEAGVEQLAQLASNSERMVTRCITDLKPQPSPRLPSGF